MKKIVLILFVVLSYNLYSQDTDYKVYIFRNYDTDKYYTGFQDPRAFITRLFFNKNFDIENTLRTISQNQDWSFDDVVLNVDVKLASEVAFYRNKYFAVGIAGSVEALMLGDKASKFHVYDFSGQFTPYVDLWIEALTDINMKVRLYPIYHQSTHYVDGYNGTIGRGSSYEFFGLNVYYYHEQTGISLYSGFEATYNYVGNGVPLFRGQVGVDYRLPISSKYSINFITGLNISAIYDYLDENDLIKNQWHPAINIAAGVEFYRYVFSLKYSYQRGRGATTYFIEQSFLGMEFSVLF